MAIKFSYGGVTVGQLHKELGKLIEQGYKRTRICVNKPSFTHALEDEGATILNVHECRVRLLEMMDDDGGWKFRKDGKQCYLTCVVLAGISYDDPKHRD